MGCDAIVLPRGLWEDSPVVDALITSRSPGGPEAFSAKIIEEVNAGPYLQRSAP
jgi:hypothetical protein